MGNGLLTEEVVLSVRNEDSSVPNQLPKLPKIHQALMNGYQLIAGQSAEGSMVALVTDKATGRAVYPDIGGALSILEEEITIPSVPFSEGHNPSGASCSRRLIASSYVIRNLDEWVKKGYTISAKWENGKIVCTLEAERQLEPPDWVVKLVNKSPGVEILWRYPNRGYLYYSVLPKDRKEPTTHLHSPSRRGRDPWKSQVTKTGYGTTFWEALERAFMAPEVEGAASRL